MIDSKIENKYIKISKKRVCQGDILKDISFFVGNPENTKVAEKITLPYSVVLTQDCDLSEDFKQRSDIDGNNDKFLKTILVCPMYGLEQFVNGEHIKGQSMAKFNTKLKSKIQKNDVYKRYHYLNGNDSGFPDSVVDFKHFYTIQREIIYNKNNSSYVCSISELFREELSQRFTNFLGRIGLPKIEQ